MIRKIFFPDKNLAPPGDQGADFVELFFDLVFVYAITRITSISAHHLDGKHVVQSVLIFWMIWWGWTQFSWALNAANTKVAEIRMIVLIATGIAFVMASSAADAFTVDVMWFAAPYILIRLVGIGMYIRSTSSASDGLHTGLILFSSVSIISMMAVFAGAVADPYYRLWWWIGAILLDLFAGFLGGREEGWGLNPGHFAERHGLIVIIALGESLIVAAAAVSSQARSQDLMIVGGLAVIVTCLLWWSYFSWIHEYMEEHLSEKTGSEQTQMARDAYSFLHFPIICGIIGVAIGFEKIMGHPHDLLTMPVAAALGGGYALYLGFTAVSVWRIGKLVLVPRIFVLALTIAGVAFSIGKPPQIALGIIAFSLLLLIFIEWKKCRHA